MESVAGFAWNGRQLCRGISGRLAVESVAAFARNTHHSPATTWNELLEAFYRAKRALFTATPFRRDRQEIKGKLVYHYPIKQAHLDGIFGDLEYVAVQPSPGVSNDIRIAQATERTFLADKAQGYHHCVMVRTDSKMRANELKQLYAEHTELKLKPIHSGHSLRHIERAIRQLEQGELDGILCVDMLGEGFDFPRLKIAAIHAPHKSLAVTLQFIGRFARTGDETIGTAKFLEIPAEIEFEAQRLYEDGAVWQNIVANLSHSRIEQEQNLREILAKFDPPAIVTVNTDDLSLYSLHPYCHVKIYRVSHDIDITQPIAFPQGFEIVFHQYSRELSAAIFVTQEIKKPRWTHVREFCKSECDLFVIYYRRNSRLLFINASRHLDSIYEHLAGQYASGTHKILSLARINRVLIGLRNPKFFNIGMKNRLHNNSMESYRTITGSSTQDVVDPADGQLYHRGHVYGKAEDDSGPVTIGYSSASKVWSNHNIQLPELLRWCRTLADKFDSEQDVTTQSGLDYLTVGEEIEELPDGVIAADWHVSAYKTPMTLRYKDGNGCNVTCDLLDVNLEIDQPLTNKTQIGIVIRGPGLDWPVLFSLTSDVYFRPTPDNEQELILQKGQDSIPLLQYLNGNRGCCTGVDAMWDE